MRLRNLILSTVVLAAVLAPSPALAAPAKPTNVAVSNASVENTAIDAAAVNVTWTKVSGAISSYVVRAVASGTSTYLDCPVAPSESPSTVFCKPLTGGTNYSFTVFAKDIEGADSPSSDAVNFIAQSVPAAPTAISAVAGVGQVTLTWNAPANSGGLALGQYRISAVGLDDTLVANSLTTKVITEDISPGSEYTFQIRATNSNGSSAVAAFSVVTVPNVPGAPTNVAALVSGSTITASWSAPAIDGGSAITGYKAYLINAAGADVGLPETPVSTSIEFTNVSAGTYTVRVVAKNLVGDSARSIASDAATVATVSTKPANNPIIEPETIPDLLIDQSVVITTRTTTGSTVTVTVSANPNGACTYDRSTGTVTGVLAGTCTINASTVETSELAAGLSKKTFSIIKLAQLITFPALRDQNLPGPLTVSAIASSGLPVVFTASGSCSATGATISFSGVGSCTVRANQAGNARFLPAPEVQQPFAILAGAGGTDPGAGGGGGGGGGGGAPKQTALYFQVVDPADASLKYLKAVCVEVYSRTLFPQFLASGCSDSEGRINVLSADAKVSIRVFELGNGAKYREYLGEVANDLFTMESATFYPGTTRFAITLSGAKESTPTPVTPTPVVPVTPTPTATPTPVAPTPTPTPTATIKNSYFVVTTSTKNLTKLVLIKNSTLVSSKVGRSLQISLKSVGVKSTQVKVSIKTPDSKTLTLANVMVSKNKGYVGPVIRFSKPGTYLVTVTLGSAKRTATVKVSK